MPHFIIDYSSNLKPEADFTVLFDALQDYVTVSPTFPLAGCRCRALACPDFRVANGNSRFGYMHVNLRVGSGRTSGELAEAGDELVQIVKQWVEQLQNKTGLLCALSFEISQIDPELTWKDNPIRAAMAEEKRLQNQV
ncbi:hypothetical protein [Thaumasiovibrio sp. DFM-14]|uniref:hypothetical protein n=1 Tax=Thaumasiovibrio sp. DFM-14 TaxID=3384792 RepID=UPI0039A04F17